MSSSTENSSSGKGATFTFVLGLFAGFAVLLALIQGVLGNRALEDPRAAEREAAKAEIDAAQHDIVGKMGLQDKDKAKALFANAAKDMAAKKPERSAMLVPGSPTQLKQAAEAAAAAPPPAPAKSGEPKAATPPPAPAPATTPPATPPAVATPPPSPAPAPAPPPPPPPPADGAAPAPAPSPTPAAPPPAAPPQS